MEPDSQEQPPDERVVALRNQIAECEKVLELMDQPGYGRLEEYYGMLAKPYEPLLRGVNTDEEIRDRAAFALYILEPVVKARAHFASRLKVLKARMARIEQDKQPQSISERVMQFFR